jgi:hypothetical protein
MVASSISSNIDFSHKQCDYAPLQVCNFSFVDIPQALIKKIVWSYSVIALKCRELHLPIAWDPVMGIPWKLKWRMLEA